MRFPSSVIIYPSVEDGDGYRTPGDVGHTCKAFILPKTTQDIQRFTGSGSRLATVGQLSNISFDVFLPPTCPSFDAFSRLYWEGNAYYAPSYYEFTGEPEAYTNTHGRLHHVQTTIKKVN
jgi:hypothetical protein